jgi:hypothetical protein
MKRTLSGVAVCVEGLESRRMLSATAVGTPTIVNPTKVVGPQFNPTIAIDESNPSRLYMVSDNDLKSIFFARSTDGGATWTGQVMFNGSNPFPQAGGTPSIATDKYGNLFVAYPVFATNAVEVLMSYDGGVTFHIIKTIKTLNGVPKLATGNNSLWVALQQQPQTGATGNIKNGGAVAYSAEVFGLGRVKPLTAEPITSVQALVDGVAVGPAGQASAVYTFTSDVGPQQIYVSTDPDGLGHKGFGPPNTQVTTQVGNVDLITGQSTNGITSSPSIAYDLSADSFTGRLYMAYVDAPSPTSSGTVIELRFSDDNGGTWSAPIQVNDDASGNSHFAPHVAVDSVTGAVAVTWYDARNDNGIPPTGGTNAFSNDDFQVYGAVGTPSPTGVDFSSNFVVQPGFSNPNDVITAAGGPFLAPPASLVQFGSQTGASFFNSQLFSAWADNSNSTNDNADGPLAQPDIYVGLSAIQVTGSTTGTFLGSFGDANGKLTYTTAAGAKVVFQLHGGQGFAVLNGANISIHLSGTTASSSLTISSTGGSARPTLGNCLINGPIGTINAPNVDLVGTFSVQGKASHVTLGNVSGGTFAATGAIGNMTVSSLASANILSGANPGADGVFAGPSDTDDAFAAGMIDSLTVHGAITASVVGAGVNPVDGVFGNGDDQIVGGASSMIKKLTAGSADSNSRFEAGAFGTVKLPGKVDPATDPRFVS